MYEESKAKRTENEYLLIWNCRYCKKQITHRLEPPVTTPKSTIKFNEEIKTPIVTPKQIPPLSDPMNPSHKMPSISTPPRLNPISDSQTPNMRTPKPAQKLHTTTKVRKQELQSTKIVERHGLTNDPTSKPAEFKKVDGLNREQSSSYERRLRNILDELQKSRNQTERLEKRISLLTRRKSFIIGSGLLISSVIDLMFAYIAKDVVLEIMGVVAFFFGVGLLLVSSERYVKSDVATLVTMSPLLSFRAMLHQLSGKGPSIYLPPVQDEIAGKLFIPWESNIDGIFPSFEEVIQNRVLIADKGVLINPVGNQLVSLVEEELGTGFVRGPLDSLLNIIKRTLTLKTGLAQRADFLLRGPNQIELILTGLAYPQICYDIDKEGELCHILGCPICSMIATLIAKTTGEPVMMNKLNFNTATETTTIAFYLRGWMDSNIHVSSRNKPSEQRTQHKSPDEHKSQTHELNNIPIQEKSDTWFDKQVDQGYCPICETPLDPKQGICPNCGIKL